MRQKYSLQLLAFVCVLSLGGCSKKESSTEWVDPNTISQGPIVHSKLSDVQVTRIERLQRTFSEVDPTPLSKWIEDFSRDQNPDREIAIWEGMAIPFEAFAGKYALTPQGKKEAFQIVLLRSGSTPDETLAHVKLQALTVDQAKELLDSFHAEPEPIRVIQK